VTTARRVHHSYREYLELLELSSVKLEYCDGEIDAMAGGTPTHADLGASDLTTFPDVTVVYGERSTASIDRNAVVNPTLLVEVASSSTEGYDRGEKLSHYKQIASLVAVLIISHRRRQVTVVERSSHGWQQREARAGETVVIESLSLSLSVDELYAGVELDPSA